MNRPQRNPAMPDTVPQDTDDSLTLTVTDDRQIWFPRTRDQFDRELISAVAFCEDAESVHATLHQDDEYRSRPTHPLYSETQTARFVLTLPSERDYADPDTEWAPVGLIGSLDEICYLLYRGEYAPRDQSLTLDRTVWLYRLVTVSPVDPSVLHWGPIRASPGDCADDLPCPE